MRQVGLLSGLNSLKLTFQFNNKARILLILCSKYTKKMKLKNCIKLMIIITCWKPSSWKFTKLYNTVACKRLSSVNSEAWLRRFDDVTGIEKSCVAKSKKVKEKCCMIATYMHFPQTWNTWKFAMFKNFIHSQLLKPTFLSPNLWNSDNQKLSNFKKDFFIVV